MSATTAPANLCLNCHTPYGPADLYCATCGCILPHVLDRGRTYHLDVQRDQPLDLRWGTGYFHARARLFLRAESSDLVIPVPLSSPSVTLGRRTGDEPVDIDLSAFGAVDLGVSRRHAKLDRGSDRVQITDLDSSNGTFLNRDRLVPGKAYLLRNRAVLQLGKLILRVQFA